MKITKNELIPNQQDYYKDQPEISADYAVAVNGISVPVHTCRVSAEPINGWGGVCPREAYRSELASLVTFDMDAPAEVCVTVLHPFTEAVLRPRSRGVALCRKGDTVCFTLREPGNFSFEVDGRHCNLHLFANPKTVYPFEKTACTYYFAPGEHMAGLITLKSGESVFIDEGAIVYGSITATDAENIGIYGRGILDYSRFQRHPLPIPEWDGLLHFIGCKNVTVEGIILRDSSWFNMTAFNCVGMEFSHAKVVGAWRYNSDGFDFINSQQVHLDGCFLRTFDDCIVLKGWRLNEVDGIQVMERRRYETMNVTDYLIENCTVWCDWGGALEIGAETVADEYRNITYRNIDIIRNDDGGMRIQSGDRAVIHDVHYENITVEYTKYDRDHAFQKEADAPYAPEDKPHLPTAFGGYMYCGLWSKDYILGNVHDITYRNIAILTDDGMGSPEELLAYPWGSFQSADETHGFTNISVEGFSVNGTPCAPNIRCGFFKLEG